VSGNHITKRQIRLYIKLRENFTQEVAASKSSISVSTAGRIEGNRHQFKKDKRGWRTRVDPLEPIWDSVVFSLLNANISPVGIFDHLCDVHIDELSSSSRRTLERRIRKWRYLHGPAQNVMLCSIISLER
jgi:hypothetical protein